MSSETAPSPVARTGALWGVLTVLLLIGTVSAAFVVYGATGLVEGGPILTMSLAIVLGAIVATLSFLLLSGILYRVDRIRGVIQREVRLFE